MFKNRMSREAAQVATLALLLQGCNVNGTTPKPTMDDDSITEQKMADSSVSQRTIQGSAVTTNKVADGAITAAKLDPAMAMSIASAAFSGGVTVGTTLGITGATIFTGTATFNNASQFNAASTFSTTTSTPITLTRIDPTNYGTTVGQLGLSSTISTSNTAASSESYFGVKGESIATTSQTTAGMTGVFGRVTLNAAGPPTITTGIGVDSELKFTAAGVVSNAYGYHTKVTYGPGPVGTVSKYVGMYIENPASGGINSGLGGTQYGVVADGSATVNFFRGSLGIGSGMDVPGATLGVNGSVILSGLASSATGDYLCIDAAGTKTVTMGGSCSLSDRRLKKDITPIKSALDGILKLTGVTYFWKNEKRGTDRQIGLVAQDVLAVFPEAVKKNADGFYSVNYSGLLGPVVEAVKELHARWTADHKLLEQDSLRLAQVEKKVELENLALKSENQRLKDRLEKIELALAQASPTKAIPAKGRKLATK